MLNKTKGNMPYKDKDWLTHKYIYKKTNMVELANMAGCCYVTLWKWMNILGIERRKSGENSKLPPRKHVFLTDTEREFIDGLLLGDGSIYTQGKNRNRVAIYGHADKRFEYIVWLSKKFKQMGFQCGQIRAMKNGYHFKTLSYAELYDIRSQWYPENKKVIPSGLKLTPTRLKNWFIGDGNHSTSPLIDSVCFPFDDLKYFIKPLINEGINYTLKTYALPSGKTRKRIRIATASRNRFIDYILSEDSEIPPGYKYKFQEEQYAIK